MPIVTPKTVALFSLGCRTNQAEIEEIGRRLQVLGYRLQQDDGEPEVVIINTCVVTAKAEAETRKMIRSLRKRFPKAKLIVIGCAAEAKNKLDHQMPEAGIYIGNKDGFQIDKIVEAVGEIRKLTEGNTVQVTSGNQRVTMTARDGVILGNEVTPESDSGYAPRHPAGHYQNDERNFTNQYIASGRKFIKIQEGCDRFCSYCLTAFVRGPVKSRPINEIIEEIQYWQDNGISEVILTGTNISLWSDDGNDITDLLKRIVADTTIPRISLSTAYPEMIDDDLIKLVTQESRLSKYFHLALQSGSETVLERMNRKVNLAKLVANLQLIKRLVPYFTFRADIIVGFPDETDKEFAETVDFIRQAGISFGHIFHFSSRPGTVAAEMLKNKTWRSVSKMVVDNRIEQLNEMLNENRKKEVGQMIGKTFNCLIIRNTNRIDSGSRQRRTDGAGMTRWSGVILGREATPESDSGCARKLAYQNDDDTQWEGLTDTNWPIVTRIKNSSFAEASADKRELRIKGTILPAEVTGFDGGQLLGEITSLPIKG